MYTKVTLGRYIVYCLLTTMLAYILTSTFTGYYCLPVSTARVISVAAAAGVFLYVLYRYAKLRITFIILVPAVLGLLLLFKRNVFLNYVWIVWAISYNCAVWFSEYIFSSIKVNDFYSQMISLAVTTLASVVLFISVVWKRYALPILLTGVVALCAMWATGYYGALYGLQKYVCIAMVIYGLLNIDYLESKWKLKRDKYSKGIYMNWLAATISVTAAVLTMANLLPYREGMINDKWMDNTVVSSIRDFWEREIARDVSSYGRFDVNTIGFDQESSKLGGGLKVSNTLLMKVKIGSDVQFPVYLRGSVKNAYTGDMWIKNSVTVSNVENNESIDKLFGNTDMVKQKKIVSMTIYPKNLYTTSIFNIWKPDRVDIGRAYYYDDDGEIYLDNVAGRAKEYSVISSVPVVYSADLRRIRVTRLTPAVQKYMEIPVSVPSRVKSLTFKIIDKYRNNFDKAEAIQNYLRENYPYTLDTSDVPKGKDFVDYFLFEERKGYCTYFASAMAVMSRIAGIPSRYVEGVVVEAGDKGNDGLYSVMSNKAHAWVELYFEGCGWVRFEPTASYREADYEKPTENINAPVNVTPTPTPVKTPEEDKANSNTGDNGGSNSQSARIYIPWSVIIPFVILLIIAARAVLKDFLYKRQMQKADRLGGKDAALEYYRILEKKLSLADINRRSDETPSEFGERIKDMLLPYNMDSNEIIDSFERVRFGNIRISNEMRESFKNAIGKADILIKAKLGTAKYLLCRYLI